jgi:hypothetical protein
VTCTTSDDGGVPTSEHAEAVPVRSSESRSTSVRNVGQWNQLWFGPAEVILLGFGVASNVQAAHSHSKSST